MCRLYCSDMGYHQRCSHCGVKLHCDSCGAPVDDGLQPGQVGQHHQMVPFDPQKRKAWETQRGRILILMHQARPNLLLAREIADKIGISPNQVNTRLGELKTMGLTFWPGSKRHTETGSPAFENQLTRAGLRLFHRIRFWPPSQ